MSISVKRIREAAAPADGFRVLVDRLWPRGMTKESAQVDLWLREIAPSNELRKWYNHEPEKWKEFQRRYRRELDGQPELVAQLIEQAAHRRVTLLFGTKEEHFNNAVALKDYLEQQLSAH